MNLSMIAAQGAEMIGASASRYDFPGLRQHGSEETLVMLALSGGGKRSAAYAYGALTALRDAQIHLGGDRHDLLGEVDVISSVSGGSFPAAYYALHRDRIFTDFEKDFLRQDIESYVYGLYLLPWHWEWMVNPLWGTNDTMMQVYDDLMFQGATYRDLIDKGRPLIVIGATDIGLGSVFGFTQRQFELLCSDLGSFPLARSVAASNGFPVLFTPITLENHRADCPEGRPTWLPQSSLATQDGETRDGYVLREFERYLDPQRVRYVHLMDGGIADNLGLRNLLNAMMLFKESDRLFDRDLFLKVRRVLVLSIDGEAAADTSWTQERVVTGLAQVISAVSGTQIDRYNFETLLLARSTVLEFAERLKESRCGIAAEIDGHACDDVQGFFGRVALTEVVDPDVRKRLERIPTGLTITDEDIDLLIEAGRDTLQRSRVLRSFLESMGDTAPSDDAPQP